MNVLAGLLVGAVGFVALTVVVGPAIMAGVCAVVAALAIAFGVVYVRCRVLSARRERLYRAAGIYQPRA